MPPKIKAKEAFYSGVTFRSRLEARWAIFFDIMGWDWDYEPCMFQITPKMRYLPDFYLPNQQLWVEVKGQIFLSRESIAKTCAAVAGKRPILLRSAPYGPARRILFAGDMPSPTATSHPIHNLVTPGEPGKAAIQFCEFTPDDVRVVADPWIQWDASGVPATRRPSEKMRQAICNPGMVEGRCETSIIENAYIMCGTLKFNDKGPIIPPEVDYFLKQRLAGRPVR